MAGKRQPVYSLYNLTHFPTMSQSETFSLNRRQGTLFDSEILFQNKQVWDGRGNNTFYRNMMVSIW